MLRHSTDYVATYAMMQTRYSMDADHHQKLFDILEKKAQKRRDYFEEFVERINQINEIKDKEAFKYDLT